MSKMMNFLAGIIVKSSLFECRDFGNILVIRTALCFIIPGSYY
jgi:hypothetical protein